MFSTIAVLSAVTEKLRGSVGMGVEDVNQAWLTVVCVMCAADPQPTNWEDITDNKPITLVNDCVSFTTTVSAR